LSYQVYTRYRKTRMAGLQSGEGRTMIDSVVWPQYINVQTDSHVAIANAAPRHCVERQKSTYRNYQLTTQRTRAADTISQQSRQRSWSKRHHHRSVSWRQHCTMTQHRVGDNRPQAGTAECSVEQCTGARYIAAEKTHRSLRWLMANSWLPANTWICWLNTNSNQIFAGNIIRPHRMHEMLAILTDVHAAYTGGGACSVCCVPCAWGHSVQPLSNHFGHLLHVK